MNQKDFIANGVCLGEHGFERDKIIAEIKERVISRGCNFVSMSPRKAPITQEDLIEWATFLAENKIYFRFTYMTQHAADGQASKISAETAKKITEIAGEYFIGDAIGETGSSMCAKLPGYYTGENDNYIKTAHRKEPVLKMDFEDMEEAHKYFVDTVSEYTSTNKSFHMPHTPSVEATAMTKYTVEAGVDFPIAELMCGSPDIILASVRGTAKCYGLDKWGTHTAHEWYGGLRHDDILKRKRLFLGYKYSYMAGSSLFELESGDSLLSSYGYRFEKDSEPCKDYVKALCEMNELIKNDNRPSGGPRVKFAFVSGLHDAWTCWGASAVYNQFYRKEWGHGNAEYSWRFLDEIGTKRSWSDVANYGETDTSALPAYGMYDIIPIESSVDVLSRYDYLVFLGWNTMTEENMDKLCEYVKCGGHLLMTAAHLNTSAKRTGEFTLPSIEKVEKLFGCRFHGEMRETNNGIKFKDVSLDGRIRYPMTKSMMVDPIYSAGYTTYAKFIITGQNAEEVAIVSDSFRPRFSDLPAVIENRIGKGTATLVTSIDYPGSPALYPLYRAIAREFISANARECEIKVIGSDRLRYAVYGEDRIYLLNTDYDLPITVKIKKADLEKTVTLDSLELKIIDIK